MVMPKQSKKYLIIGPSWVGDMVMAQSMFIDIKQREPNSQIDVLAPAWSAALIDRMPEVSKLISTNFKHGKLSLGERYRLAKSLRKDGYTNAIILPNSLKSALVPVVAKVPIRSGYVGEQRWAMVNDIRRLDKQAMPMTVQRFIALGLSKDSSVRGIDAIPAPLLKVDNSDVEAALKSYQLLTDKKTLVLCPGAEFGPAKQWPKEYYAELAREYLSREWQVWLMGSERDLETCEYVDQQSEGKCQVLAGKTSLPEAVDLISVSSLVVSNDSGLMHIAAALQKPLVAIYGSTDPAHTPPLSGNHAIVKLDIDCSPCFQRECPLQHLNCLNQLVPQQVLSATEEVLQ
ncbi:MAG: lipopolysaccharide heptosyltransferase II [Acidiferrobacterales bacterium]|nr:lipopolysaccharide heptosyltransferase II [Acidiferrobacterales bacterium]